MLEFRLMYHYIQLTADLVIQYTNMIIQQGFIQSLNFLRRFFQQREKNTDRRCDSLIRRHISQRIIVLKKVKTI